MTDEVLGALLEKLADRLVDRIVDGVVQRLQGAGNGFIDQTCSPLGPRRHISLIRHGKLPGTQVGRLYVARSSDVEAYIGKHPTAVVVEADERADEVDELAAELGLQKRIKGGK
jgi:hypothetical protein